MTDLPAHGSSAARRPEDPWRALADHAPLPLWLTDDRGSIAFVNRACCDSFGVTAEMACAGSWRLPLHPDDRPSYVEALDTALGQEASLHAQVRLKKADGQWRWVDLRGQPRFGSEGELLGLTCSASDITDLREALERLREVDGHKTEFLGVLSHELRNPLTPIKNNLHLLDRASPGSEQARKAQTVIERQIELLVRLVDDLLDVTRISRGKIELKRQRLELGELGSRAIEDHRSQFERAGVHLEWTRPEAPVLVDADGARLDQVMGNLLQNAARHTPRGGSCRVSVSRDDGGEEAILRVADTGSGMEPETIEQLFQPFLQAPKAPGASHSGLGLGLALVKGLLELHGGRIEARSEGPGCGSEFLVGLPLAEPVDQPDGVALPPPAPRRVLIIEDNVDIAQSLRELLELDGHEVSLAHTGPAGLALAREQRPHLVLCDIGLPGMDGHDVARAIRRDDTLRATALVALSGYAQPEDRQRSFEAGFDRHLAKPVDPELLEKVFQGLPRGQR